MSADPVFPVGTPEAVADLSVSSVARAHGLGAAWVDRDLSWLEFNRRVLQEALDERTPLLERVKFVAIFASNLDEFFMKRMALIRPPHDDTGFGAEDKRQKLSRLRELITSMLADAARCYAEVLRPRLAQHGVRLAAWDEL